MPEVDNPDQLSQQLHAARQRTDTLQAENDALRAENARLRALLRLDPSEPQVQAPLSAELGTILAPGGLPYADRDSPAPVKIRLFRALFTGRTDLYATAWVSSRTGKNGWSPAEVDRWGHREDDRREFLPLTDAVIEAHLRGDADPRKDLHVSAHWS